MKWKTNAWVFSSLCLFAAAANATSYKGFVESDTRVQDDPGIREAAVEIVNVLAQGPLLPPPQVGDLVRVVSMTIPCLPGSDFQLFTVLSVPVNSVNDLSSGYVPGCEPEYSPPHDPRGSLYKIGGVWVYRDWVLPPLDPP